MEPGHPRPPRRCFGDQHPGHPPVLTGRLAWTTGRRHQQCPRQQHLRPLRGPRPPRPNLQPHDLTHPTRPFHRGFPHGHLARHDWADSARHRRHDLRQAPQGHPNRRLDGRLPDLPRPRHQRPPPHLSLSGTGGMLKRPFIVSAHRLSLSNHSASSKASEKRESRDAAS